MIQAFLVRRWAIRRSIRRREMSRCVVRASMRRMVRSPRRLVIKTTCAKMARDTEAHLLETWFNRNVVGVFKQHHAFDAGGFL